MYHCQVYLSVDDITSLPPHCYNGMFCFNSGIQEDSITMQFSLMNMPWCNSALAGILPLFYFLIIQIIENVLFRLVNHEH